MPVMSLQRTITPTATTAARPRRLSSLNRNPCTLRLQRSGPGCQCGARKEVGATRQSGSPTQICSRPTLHALTYAPGPSVITACIGTPGVIHGAVCGVRVELMVAAMREREMDAPALRPGLMAPCTHGWWATP